MAGLSCKRMKRILLYLWSLPFYLILLVFRWWTFRGKAYPSSKTGVADAAIIDPFLLTIYVLPPGYPLDKRLLAHEQKHVEQVERDGRTVFIAKYLFWLFKYGYKKNPYETEAREAELAA